MIVRQGIGRRLIRLDYHAVPWLLAANKQRAQSPFEAWSRRVGPAELIYTRNAEGRRLLPQDRARALSAAFAHSARRLDRWQ